MSQDARTAAISKRSTSAGQLHATHNPNQWSLQVAGRLDKFGISLLLSYDHGGTYCAYGMHWNYSSPAFMFPVGKRKPSAVRRAQSLGARRAECRRA